MRVPLVRGIIDRRILTNFRVDPDVLRRILPEPFRPKLARGVGVAGICLIRLKSIRPSLMPSFLGISSENAAHRIAVEWEVEGERREGVFIPRRDTSSWVNVLVGGRLYPGEHHRARFEVRESDTDYYVALTSDDRKANMLVDGTIGRVLPSTSVFATLDEASEFFETGSLGYSMTAAEGRFDGLELRSRDWVVSPLDVRQVESSFFDDAEVFPPGSAEFDCALLMRDIDHEWIAHEQLCWGGAAASAA